MNTVRIGLLIVAFVLVPVKGVSEEPIGINEECPEPWKKGPMAAIPECFWRVYDGPKSPLRDRARVQTSKEEDKNLVWVLNSDPFWITHVDGAALLPSEGPLNMDQFVPGWILLAPGQHRIRIQGVDLELEFQRLGRKGKYGWWGLNLGGVADIDTEFQVNRTVTTTTTVKYVGSDQPSYFGPYKNHKKMMLAVWPGKEPVHYATELDNRRVRCETNSAGVYGCNYVDPGR